LKNFRTALNTQDFVITSEIFLRPETNSNSIQIQADILRDYVDAILITDNQSGRVHMSSLAAGVLLLDAGIDPIVQLSCRNRNRISLLSDLLGCSALGITSISLVRGDKVPDDFQPRPKAIVDVTATELIQMANIMKNDGKIDSPQSFFLGGVITAHRPKPGWPAKNITEKVDAGAQFVITHTCLDMDLLRLYMQRLSEIKLLWRCHVVVGIAILSSAEDAQWLRKNRPNVNIPNDIVTRLSNAKDPKKEGIAICVEQLQELSTIPGISGAHIIAPEKLTNIPVAVDQSGTYKKKTN
jgi:methylenetetrahydrofolate reductase (NADPH)|tara:strand:+ start:6877 stop:7767 length:891 start_codon:yes stop_codon:yes gene_type:complete